VKKSFQKRKAFGTNFSDAGACGNFESGILGCLKTKIKLLRAEQASVHGLKNSTD
jgi:hypothetical protein